MSRLPLVLLIVIVAMFPWNAQAGHGHRHSGGRCGQCQMAPLQCQCGVAAAPVIPQVSTQYCPQQVITMQPVTRTEVRREAQVISVPVTTQRQVTVDEGSYQTVWVPRLVTKNVAETTVQQQLQYRDVAYQVTRQVPVAQTRMIPTQTLTYGIAPQMSLSPAAPVIVGSVPGPIPEPMAAAASAHPVPSASMTDGSSGQPWTKVPPRMAKDPPIELQHYERSVVSEPAGRFPSAPSAATVWRAQSTFTR